MEDVSASLLDASLCICIFIGGGGGGASSVRSDKDPGSLNTGLGGGGGGGGLVVLSSGLAAGVYEEYEESVRPTEPRRFSTPPSASMLPFLWARPAAGSSSDTRLPSGLAGERRRRPPLSLPLLELLDLPLLLLDLPLLELLDLPLLLDLTADLAAALRSLLLEEALAWTLASIPPMRSFSLTSGSAELLVPASRPTCPLP